MDFKLNDEQRMVRDMVRELADGYLAEHARQLDEERPSLDGHIAKLSELGVIAPIIPEEYDGPGFDALTYAIISEEVGRVCASTATTIGAHCSLCSYPIMLFGTEEQKQEWLPKLASGEAIGSFGLTEPSAGSDAAGIRTTAVPDGNGNYIINGSKQWITNGSFADVIVLLANTNPDRGLMGITGFIVPYDTPGFERGAMENTMGIRGSQQSVLNFNDMKVPADWILGGKKGMGRGFMYAMKTLDSGRIGVAAMSVGIAQTALEKSIEFIKTREQFGKAISEFQGLQWYLAEMAADIYAARTMVYRVAVEKEEGKNIATQAAMIKLFCTEMAQKTVDKALQLHGGYGYCKDYTIERLYRDVRITRIYEGTNEIQKNIIARDVLKKDPRTWI
jgi:butyryl-CoA dehydrogenase